MKVLTKPCVRIFQRPGRNSAGRPGLCAGRHTDYCPPLREILVQGRGDCLQLCSRDQMNSRVAVKAAVGQNAEMSEAQQDSEWRTEGSDYIGLTALRTMHDESSGEPVPAFGKIVGWLSAEESDFVSEVPPLSSPPDLGPWRACMSCCSPKLLLARRGTAHAISCSCGAPGRRRGRPRRCGTWCTRRRTWARRTSRSMK